MKVLVTGAAGFIGSNLAERLAKSSIEVLGVDNFNNYYSPQLKKRRVKEFFESNNIRFKHLDLGNLKLTQSLVKSFNPDSIIHLAARPGVRTPPENFHHYIQNNLVAYSNILQVAVLNEIQNFMYASSSSVYGNSTSIRYSEQSSLNIPVSLYGATKLSNEILAPAYISGSNTKARGMRFFTVYGPWGRPDMAYFRIIDSALNGSNFIKFGEGKIKRDFTFIDDVSLIIEKLLFQLINCDPGFSDVVNIGGGNPYSLNDLMDVISLQTKSKIPFSEVPINLNDTNYTCADTNKLIELIGVKPQIELKEGIEKTIYWAKQPWVSNHLLKWINSTI